MKPHHRYIRRAERDLLERAVDLRILINEAESPKERERYRATLERVERRIARLRKEQAARWQQRDAEEATRHREAESAHEAKRQAAEAERQQAEHKRESEEWVKRHFRNPDAPRRPYRQRQPQGPRVIKIGTEEIVIDE